MATMNRFKAFQSYKNYLIFSFIFIALYSCTGIRTIPPAEFEAIDHNFKGTFTSKVCKFRGLTMNADVFQLFKLDQMSEEKFNISFDSTGVLKISSVSGKWSNEFRGKFKRGFHQIYLRKKRIEIPPVFPLIYSNVDVYRLRIAYHRDGYLMIENKYFKGKSILFLGGGGGQRNVYFFSKDNCN